MFRAALAVLNVLEPEIMKQTDFNEMYILLDTKPKEMINTPEILIKHINKFQNIKTSYIKKLREKNRYVVMQDQKNTWLDNSRAGCPTDSDTPIFKKIKFLNKFFLLNKAIRRIKDKSLLSEVNSESFKLKDHHIKCNIKWPLWLYDFTVRTRISNFFIFKVAKPVRIIPDHFSEDKYLEKDEGFEYKFILVPYLNKDVTIYDTETQKRKKRLKSAQLSEDDCLGKSRLRLYCEESPSKIEESTEIIDDDMLLLSRETHSWVYKGFETHFQQLFDDASEMLFLNWTVHSSYGNEISSAEWVQTFVNEILSSKEINYIKRQTETGYDANEEVAKQIKQFSFHRMKSMANVNMKITERKFERLGSLIIPNDGINRQIFLTAFDVIGQSMALDSESEGSQSDDN